MTLWAFVSDIHGNRPALEAAERIAYDRGAERFVCLGDVIGKGDPSACVAWVRDRAAYAIVGNRDLDYIDRVPAELQAVVRSWPNEVRDSDFILSHGEPRLHPALNSAAERDGFQRVRRYMVEHGARVWFFGHTHRSRAWELTPDHAAPLAQSSIDLHPACSYVVNVGTTGLPLPGRGPAAFAFYDDTAQQVEHIVLQGDNLRRRLVRSQTLV